MERLQSLGKMFYKQAYQTQKLKDDSRTVQKPLLVRPGKLLKVLNCKKMILAN